MAALKSIVLIISLFNVAFALEAAKDLRVTKTWSKEVKGFHYLSKVDNHIVTISIEENNTVQIIFPPEMKKTPCLIPLEIPEDKALDPQIWARELGNGKIVLTTELRSLATDNSYDSNFFIVVDPSECTTKKIEIPGAIYFTLYQRIPVAFDNMFDVFPDFSGFNNTQVRAIKRYTEDGKEIMVPHQIDLDVDLDGYLPYVYPINSKNPFAGYLVVVNSVEGATLSLLNSKLEVTKQIERKEARINTASTSFNSITICYVKQEHVVCELLDKDLKTKFEVPMMQEPESEAYNSWAANLPDGGAMVILQHGFTELASGVSPTRRTESAHVQRIFKDGSTSKPVELGRDLNSTHRPRGFVMDNGEYCAGNVATTWNNQHSRFPARSSSIINAICVDTLSE